MCLKYGILCIATAVVFIAVACVHCLCSHNSVSFIPLKYVKLNLPCKYLQRGMNVKYDVIHRSV